MRALATIETVTKIMPIEGADNIVVAQVRGWNVVVKKDEFKEGDICVYHEIDSFLPVSNPHYAFLEARGTKTNEAGVKGHVLKTVRLRGVYSQGLALPVTDFPEISSTEVGTDVTEKVGAEKWEEPIPAELVGVSAGNWPYWLSKTSERRAQNVANFITHVHANFAEEPWEAYEKIDGLSMSAFIHEGEFMVGSRTVNLLNKQGNIFWEKAQEMRLEELLRDLGLDAVQGELYGEGINKNPLGVQGTHYKIFDVWMNGERVPRCDWAHSLSELSVPRREEYEKENLFTDVETLVSAVDGVKSVLSPDKNRLAEGIVFRHPTKATVSIGTKETSAKASFKVISNKYLLKHS